MSAALLCRRLMRKEQQKLKTALPEMQCSPETKTDKTESLQKFAGKIKQIINSKELTSELIHESTDRMAVYALSSSGGKRVPLIDIYPTASVARRNSAPKKWKKRLETFRRTGTQQSKNGMANRAAAEPPQFSVKTQKRKGTFRGEGALANAPIIRSPALRRKPRD